MITVNKLSDAARITLQRECIVEHMRAENAHDWDAVYDTFIRDERSSYDVIPMSAVFSGFKVSGSAGPVPDSRARGA
ncbi:hypothetical protein [Paraburkholderia sp. BR14374]|uniref:hypothetical protein n=1 Tax=Paraburkholderia sp. BR14374 TaxID=3237007 RepID=UPI0034CD205E